MREHAENPAGTGTALTAMLFSGGRAAPAHRRSRAFRLRDGQLRRIATSSPLACSPMLARHADGRPDRWADVGLRIGGRTCCVPTDPARSWTTELTFLY